MELLSLEYGSERALGDEGPLLDTKLGGPLQPIPKKFYLHYFNKSHTNTFVFLTLNFYKTTV